MHSFKRIIPAHLHFFLLWTHNAEIHLFCNFFIIILMFVNKIVWKFFVLSHVYIGSFQLLILAYYRLIIFNKHLFSFHAHIIFSSRWANLLLTMPWWTYQGERSCRAKPWWILLRTPGLMLSFSKNLFSLPPHLHFLLTFYHLTSSFQSIPSS